MTFPLRTRKPAIYYRARVKQSSAFTAAGVKSHKMALLSAAMIVGNEEAFLSNCLQSIRNIVDEIVVVDTGSTDQTVSIAKQFDANVSVFPWKGDFAVSRNEALQCCQSRWKDNL